MRIVVESGLEVPMQDGTVLRGGPQCYGKTPSSLFLPWGCSTSSPAVAAGTAPSSGPTAPSAPRHGACAPRGCRCRCGPPIGVAIPDALATGLRTMPDEYWALRSADRTASPAVQLALALEEPRQAVLADATGDCGTHRCPGRRGKAFEFASSAAVSVVRATATLPALIESTAADSKLTV